MSGLMAVLIYVVCLFMGFCGGIFGYFFAKTMEKKKAKKQQPETVSIPC